MPRYPNSTIKGMGLPIHTENTQFNANESESKSLQDDNREATNQPTFKLRWE